MATIDIILTVTDQSGHLRGTLDSLGAQTMRGWRLLAVYHGGLEGVRAELESGDDRIIPIELSADAGGVAAMRNVALRRVESEMVCFLDC
ncbi:MAG: glycosyltransferase family 2 protein, partial [Phycisphaerales bacterium]|nr:glycosyltransferase family 2 protein [Phycisphaerales bacterium]